jgi:hypothetical protein
MSNESQNPASCQTAVSGSAFSIHDLKCGNILNYDTAEGEILNYDTAEGEILPTVIDWQDLKWLTEDQKGFNLVHSPIPLTEELILKFGFSDKDYKNGYIGKDFKSGGMILDFVLSKPFQKGEWQNAYTFDFDGHRFIKFEFAHELQNFYYSMTGVMLSLS